LSPARCWLSGNGKREDCPFYFYFRDEMALKGLSHERYLPLVGVMTSSRSKKKLTVRARIGNFLRLL